MKAIDRHTMTCGDVARALGLSVERVRQLDEKLRPVRLPSTDHRRYDPAQVEKLIVARRGAR